MQHKPYIIQQENVHDSAPDLANSRLRVGWVVVYVCVRTQSVPPAWLLLHMCIITYKGTERHFLVQPVQDIQHLNATWPSKTSASSFISQILFYILLMIIFFYLSVCMSWANQAGGTNWVLTVCVICQRWKRKFLFRQEAKHERNIMQFSPSSGQADTLHK